MDFDKRVKFDWVSEEAGCEPSLREVLTQHYQNMTNRARREALTEEYIAIFNKEI